MRPSIITNERNPLQQAYDNYHEMEQERDNAVARAVELATLNNSLVAEAGMLRELLKTSDADRIRFQSIASTLLGRLLAINDCIAGAVKASIRDGIDAADTKKTTDDLERAGAEAQEIIQRLEPVPAPETPGKSKASQQPPQAVGAAIPAVDWNRPSQ